MHKLQQGMNSGKNIIPSLKSGTERSQPQDLEWRLRLHHTESSLGRDVYKIDDCAYHGDDLLRIRVKETPTKSSLLDTYNRR
jgi:hypothetical protein